MYKQAKHTTITLAILGALALMSGSLAMAGSVTLTNTFVTGQPATAASVNSKFAETGTAINDNDGRITTNTGNISTNTTNITAQTSSIGTNTSNIGINTTLIGSNTTLINANMTAIVENADQIGTNTSDIDGVYSDILTNADSISANSSDIGTNSLRITALEDAPGGAPSSADNPIINVDCETQSLQAAIETAPVHGKTNIVISGACVDDIFLRRGGITIEGIPGDGADSITGNATGFSSDPLDNFNLPAAGGALVQRTLKAAIEMEQRPRVILKNLTINAGENASAVSAIRNSSLRLINVTLNGGAGYFGLHASNSDVILKGSTATGGSAAFEPVSGSAILAENNSAIELLDGNTFNGADGDTQAFVALSGSSVRWTGGTNVINAGLPGIDNETEALVVALNSSLLQLTPAIPASATKGNVINGSMSAGESSSIHLRNVAISNSDFIEAFAGSTISLQPMTAGAITVVIPEGGMIEAGNGSTLDFADYDFPLNITNPAGGALMRLLDHSTLLLFSGSTLNMNVQMFRGSSIDAGDNARINGDLDLGGYSSAAFNNQGVSPAEEVQPVTGNVYCNNSEANWIDADTFFNNLCFFGDA